MSIDGAVLVKRQEALIRKVVSELRDFDNVYYELCTNVTRHMTPASKTLNWLAGSYFGEWREREASPHSLPPDSDAC